jgi:hypothetical protein
MFQEPTEVKETATVGELQDKEYLSWVDLSQDIKAIKDHIGGISEEYDTFFVDIQNGGYVEIWGMYNTVPYLHKTVYRIV